MTLHEHMTTGNVSCRIYGKNTSLILNPCSTTIMT